MKKNKTKKDKQAVIIIHGVGEQRPMDTLRRFVKAVWETDTSVHHANAILGTFSKPDDISGSFELRRLTTTKNKKGVRTDFFEYYWAHLMEGNKVSHVLAWLRRIICRLPWNLPNPLIGVWFFVVFVGLGVLFFAFNQALPKAYKLIEVQPVISVIVAFVLLPFFVWVLESIVGDAARYLDPNPKNIKRRQEIRTNGIKILKKIHESGKYDRIILVGHSLGSFIAYDILTHAWQEYNKNFSQDAAFPELDKMEELLRSGNTDTKTFRDQQAKVFREQLNNGGNWLVSDLVTLGSPLTYADLLLAEDKEGLSPKKEQRELPTAPPQMEKVKGVDRISYGENEKRRLHHAAMFAVTRWTNIYFPPSMTIFGDIISGPLKPMFGYGIEDVETKTSINMGLFSHTYYWTPEKKDATADHILKLRKALNLLDN